MEEEWKGEHLIRAKPANNRKEATRMVQVLYHARRRSEGAPVAGAKKHRALMKATLGEIAKR